MNERLSSIIWGFIIILIGVVLLDVVADEVEETKTTGSRVNETLTMSSTKNTVAYEAITIASSTGNTANIGLFNLTFFGNTTLNTSNNFINISSEVNWTRGGVLRLISNFSDGSYNVSYIYDTDGTAQTSEDDVTTVSYFGNANISTESTTISLSTHVNWTLAGVITIDTLNFTDVYSDATSIDYNISYEYQPDKYVKNATARTLLPLVIIFFAIAIMALGVALAFKGFKDVMNF